MSIDKLAAIREVISEYEDCNADGWEVFGSELRDRIIAILDDRPIARAANGYWELQDTTPNLR